MPPPLPSKVVSVISFAFISSFVHSFTLDKLAAAAAEVEATSVSEPNSVVQCNDSDNELCPLRVSSASSSDPAGVMSTSPTLDKESTAYTYVSALEEGGEVPPAPRLRPGEMSQLRWIQDGTPVHEFGYRIGLPTSLGETLRSYAEHSGIADMYRSLYVEGFDSRKLDDLDVVEQEDGNFLITTRDMENSDDEQEGRVSFSGVRHKFYMHRPGSHFKQDSDMRWTDPADERTQEELLHVLAEGGFDTVLRALGEQWDHIHSLAIQGVGFVGVSRCRKGYYHVDFEGLEGRAFGVLVPVYLAEEERDTADRQPEFMVATYYDEDDDEEEEYGDEDDDDDEGYYEDEYEDGYDEIEPQRNLKTTRTTESTEGSGKRKERRGEVKYEQGVALMTGDMMYHGTNSVDYTKTNDFRLTLSVYIADITRTNVQNLADDDTALFPVAGRDDWLFAQRARHWTADGHSLSTDRGRTFFPFDDEDENCVRWAKEGHCETDALWTRTVCLKSCETFMNYEDYRQYMMERKGKGETTT